MYHTTFLPPVPPPPPPPLVSRLLRAVHPAPSCSFLGHELSSPSQTPCLILDQLAAQSKHQKMSITSSSSSLPEGVCPPFAEHLCHSAVLARILDVRTHDCDCPGDHPPMASCQISSASSIPVQLVTRSAGCALTAVCQRFPRKAHFRC